MPELPEVDGLRVRLGATLSGRRVDRLAVLSIAALKTFDPPAGALSATTVRGTQRRGKFLSIDCDDLHLVIHLARAGWVRWFEALTPAKSMRGPIAAELRFQDGSGLRFTEQGTEKRLAIYIVRELEDVPGIAGLGIDVLDPAFTPAHLATVFRTTPGTLKGLLADQHAIAGIGNAYSDEILHAARLSPFARPASLSDEANAALHDTMVGIMTDAAKRAAGREISELKDDKRTHLRVHGRAGQPCDVCGSTLRSVHSGNRSWQYCPTCQTGGKILADRRLSKLLK